MTYKPLWEVITYTDHIEIIILKPCSMNQIESILSIAKRDGLGILLQGRIKIDSKGKETLLPCEDK